MASSGEIPNLKTLLGSRRGGGLRSRGRGRGGFRTSHEEEEQVRDDAVKGTDQDAAGSRVSCVEMGYLNDPYAKLFATQPATRRLPLLNRGTYVRTSAIDQLVANFLTTDASCAKQIVSFGAGTDTRYFRLLDSYLDMQFIYHEVDFPTNTSAKIASIQKQPLLHTKLLHTPIQSDSYYSECYNIHGLDLRVLAHPLPNTPPPSLPNLNPNLPTLFLSEMCLVYLQPQVVQQIMSKFLTSYLCSTTPASLILYEPILPQDAFGRTMIANLQSRNIRLPTLTTYPELSDQRARLRSYGFTAEAKAADTSFIWREWVAEAEKERVAGLEFLDELEELELLLRHYCVAWGWRDGSEGGQGRERGQENLFSRAWGEVREQAR